MKSSLKTVKDDYDKVSNDYYLLTLQTQYSGAVYNCICAEAAQIGFNWLSWNLIQTVVLILVS